MANQSLFSGLSGSSISNQEELAPKVSSRASLLTAEPKAFDTETKAQMLGFGGNFIKGAKEIGSAIADIPSDVKQGATSAGKAVFERGEKLGSELYDLKQEGAFDNMLKTRSFKDEFKDLSKGDIFANDAKEVRGLTAIPGAVAGAFGDVIGEGVGAVMKAPATPEMEKEIGQDIEGLGKKIAENETVQAGVEKFQALPEDTQAVLGDVGSVAGLALDVTGVGLAKKPLTQGLKSVASKASELPEAPSLIDLVKARKAKKTTETPSKVKIGKFEVDVQKPTLAGQTLQKMHKPLPTKAEEFAKTSGKPMGEWLVDRGIIDTPEKTISKLYERFKKSKEQADKGFEAITGKFNAPVLRKVTDTLLENERKIAKEGASSMDKKLIENLSKKLSKDGITMTEINSLKRLYERTIKTAYNKDITKTSTQIQGKTNLDSALRDWQSSEAKKRGFKDLSEINKETMQTRFVMDAIGERYLRQQSNNAVSLTDWIVATGASVNPAFLGALISKKYISSDSFAKMFAKAVGARKKTVGEPQLKSIESIERKSKLKDQMTTGSKNAKQIDQLQGVKTKKIPLSNISSQTSKPVSSGNVKIKGRRDALNHLAEVASSISGKKVSVLDLEKRYGKLLREKKVNSIEDFVKKAKEAYKDKGNKLLESEMKKDISYDKSGLTPELKEKVDSIAKKIYTRAIPISKTLGIKIKNPTQADAIDFLRTIDAPTLKNLSRGNKTASGEYIKGLRFDELDEFSLGNKLDQDEAYEAVIKSIGEIQDKRSNK